MTSVPRIERPRDLLLAQLGTLLTIEESGRLASRLDARQASSLSG